MGQYYRIALKSERNKNFKYLDRTLNGEYTLAKLMEHSWLGNYMTEAVCKKLYHKPQQIAWIGDYADQESLEQVNVENLEKNNYLPILEEAWHIDDDDKQPDYFKDKGLKADHSFSLSEKCLVNHNKKLVLFGPIYLTKIRNLHRRDFWNKYDKLGQDRSKKEELLKDYSWSVDMIPHPLPLLTAVGNGLGGGDYWGVNKEQVGAWAFDTLEVVNYDEAIKLIGTGDYKLYNIIFSETLEKLPRGKNL